METSQHQPDPQEQPKQSLNKKTYSTRSRQPLKVLRDSNACESAFHQKPHQNQKSQTLRQRAQSSQQIQISNAGQPKHIKDNCQNLCCKENQSINVNSQTEFECQFDLDQIYTGTKKLTKTETGFAQHSSTQTRRSTKQKSKLKELRTASKPIVAVHNIVQTQDDQLEQKKQKQERQFTLEQKEVQKILGMKRTKSASIDQRQPHLVKSEKSVNSISSEYRSITKRPKIQEKQSLYIDRVYESIPDNQQKVSEDSVISLKNSPQIMSTDDHQLERDSQPQSNICFSHIDQQNDDAYLIEHMINQRGFYVVNPYYLQVVQQPHNSSEGRSKTMTAQMRTEIFDWMMALSQKEGFSRQTFSLAICYFDLVLSKKYVRVQELQLLAVTCLWIAMKNEEEFFTSVARFSNSTDQAYNTDEIKTMEKDILRALNFRLLPDTCTFWLEYLTKKWDEENQVENQHLMFKPASLETLRQMSSWSRIVQVIDLISMDINMLQFDKCGLVAAVILYELSDKFQVLQQPITACANDIDMVENNVNGLYHNNAAFMNTKKHQDLIYFFQKMDSFFSKHLQGYDAMGLFSEVLYVSRFFMLPTELKEPVCRFQGRQYGNRLFRSKNQYFSVQQQTTKGAEFIVRLNQFYQVYYEQAVTNQEQQIGKN